MLQLEPVLAEMTAQVALIQSMSQLPGEDSEAPNALLRRGHPSRQKSGCSRQPEPASGSTAGSTVMAMTMEYLHGLAVSNVLRSSPARRRQLIAHWARVAKILLDPPD